jgi:hypothetical protein
MKILFTNFVTYPVLFLFYLDVNYKVNNKKFHLLNLNDLK